MSDAPTIPPTTLRALRSAAGEGWPEAAFRILGEAGVLGWPVPDAYGGSQAGDMTAAYVDLADADLTACFVLTQQNSAVGRIVAGDSPAARERWLPKIAAGDAFATVGLSHLSTSRQHAAAPPVTFRWDADACVLDGVVPWSTSAARADVIVVGAVAGDGGQVLVAVPGDAAGVSPGDAMPLLALGGSSTGVIRLDSVRVGRDAVLAGPAEVVMKSGSSGGTGSLTTSALAVGLSQRAVRLLGEEAAGRPDVAGPHEAMRAEFDALKADLLAAAAGTEGHTAESLRTRANSLALRSTQALMTASKGAGFVVGHPAERAVREAMFFLVWSCPKPVAAAAMDDFACSLAR